MSDTGSGVSIFPDYIVLQTAGHHGNKARFVRPVPENHKRSGESEPMTTSKPKSWRDALAIHSAAEMFPMISAEELKVLGADIRKNGQRVAITVWKAQKHSRPVLLDGRNRLDAMEAVGIEIRVDHLGTDLNPSVKLFKHMPPDGMWWPIEITELSGGDPDAYVISTNLHRRHLDA